MPYIKVLRRDLTSLGLRGARRIKYRVGKWVKPLEPPSPGLWNGGGLWVVKNKSGLKRIQKHMMTTYGVAIRAFRCDIGGVLDETSYRVKTDKVRLTEEIKIERRKEWAKGKLQ